MILIPLGIIFVLTILMCKQESERREISFLGAFVLCLLVSPLFGYFFITSRPYRQSYLDGLEVAQKPELKVDGEDV